MIKQAALIAPTPDLHLVAGRRFHLVEAPVVFSSREYRDFYRNEAQQGAYVTVDNGTWMYRTPVTPADLARAISEVGAAEVVIPDAFEDADETVFLCRDFLRSWHDDITRLMVVPQGKSSNGWLACWKQLMMALEGRPATIAIPKHMERKVFGGRKAIADAIWKRYDPDAEIHLLGGTGYPPRDLDLLQQNPLIRSIDTSEPFACAQQKIHLPDSAAVSRGALDFEVSAGELGTWNLEYYKCLLEERGVD